MTNQLGKWSVEAGGQSLHPRQYYKVLGLEQFATSNKFKSFQCISRQSTGERRTLQIALSNVSMTRPYSCTFNKTQGLRHDLFDRDSDRRQVSQVLPKYFGRGALTCSTRR
ncbi:hypothetical protein JDV02_007035 [Purpureocillium takamizusanense]|uniref:Uncharacterized protein n=1 Tax=Purpureocillium takamizusanense TaxID=2060973 RepID=A0A9Q8VDP0_9HYPO|nr:uncharacterized protein JDV02_007035 [Purpureocillium takamizusanense]UNI21002.1 hypothetical protein JDV02_007035 [Purpureocillium takamizusanense]